jgi:hypothetical protein
VFGILSIVLIFTLGRLAEDARTGFLAAAFLAFNGHQIYWSRIARPSTLVCALGLLSCVFLVLATRSQSARREYQWLYMLAALAGLASAHYFWMILAGQMTFCFVNMGGEQDAYRAILVCQLLIVALAAPLVTLAVFQGGAPYLGDDVTSPATGLLDFGFLFEGSSRQTVLLARLRPSLAAVGAGLLLAGLLSVGRGSREAAVAWKEPNARVFAVVAGLACAYTLAFASILAGMRPVKTHLLAATSALPAAAFAAAWMLNRHARHIAKAGQLVRLVPIMSHTSRSLLSVMAIVPFGLTVVASTVTPLMASRHLLIFVPYFLLVMTRGLLWLLGPMDRRPRRVALATVLVGAAVVHAASIRYNLQRHQSPHDYQGLAERWKPQVQTADVILVADHFRTTPLFYYMKPSDYVFVGRGYSTEVRKRNQSRVWVLRIAGLPPLPNIEEAVAGYERAAEVRAGNIGADLYVRPPALLEPR